MASSKLSLSFRIFKNGQLIREEQLSQGVIKIGKVPSAHLRIDDEACSRMHAIIEVTGSEVSVIDLGSTGGTFVNGQTVNKAKLQSGDTLRVGDSHIELAIGETATAPVVTVVPPPLPVRPAPTPVLATPVLAAPVAPRPAIAPPAPSPHTVMPLMAAASPAMFQAAMADSIEEGGARAIEVAAMLGDSVVSVKHCMDPRGGKVTPATWGLAAGGLACLIASAASFYVAIDTAAMNKEALQYHTQTLHRPARAFRPVLVSPAIDFLGFGGLALGLVGVTTGLARSRRERRSPFYRIGTAPEVEQPIEDAPSDSFPLVAPSGDDFVFNYGAGIEGELIVGGASTPLSELVAQGRARPSLSTAGAIEVPIPAMARIRARAGKTTFLVSAVARPRQQAMPLVANLERRALGIVAASLAAHLGLVWFLDTIPADDSGVNLDLASNEELLLRASLTNQEETPPPPEQDQPGEDTGKAGAGATMALDEGESGKPDSQRADGHLRIENKQAEPQLSRAEAIEAARSAGVLGDTQALSASIHALTGTADFSSGFDAADIYGPLFGAEGEGHGNFGFGRKGFGPGGGCTMEPCGIVGAGAYGTAGNGTKAGDGYGGGGSWGHGRNHTPSVPPPTIGLPTSGGGLDKVIIKRYIKRNVQKIAYCYESELLAHPGIEGEVMVNFLITGSGTVTSSTGGGFDGKVASCVASVIKNIEFPRPTDGGNVQVNYPFTFHAAGH